MSANRPFQIKGRAGWYIKITLPSGKRSHRKIGDTREQAFSYLKYGSQSGTRYADCAASFVDDILQRLNRGEVSKGWYDRMEATLKRFGSDHPQIPISGLSPYLVKQWLSKRDLAADTERTIIGDLKQCLDWCVSHGVIDSNPIKGLKKPVGKPRDNSITLEQHKLFVENSQPKFRPLLEAAWETGCRPGELRELQWSMVSKCRQFAVLTKHKSAKKTKKPRVIYFGPKTKAWLESQKKSTGFVFTNRFGKQYTKDSVRQRIARLREKLGIENVVAYSYRHAFPARSIMQGVDIATVAELMGHSSLEMLSRVYGHLEREQKHLIDATHKSSQVD